MSECKASTIAARVRAGDIRVVKIIEATLARIGDRDHVVNAFTTVTRERALRKAEALDARIARGEDPGPLAGVPFGAKDLFDIQGITTIAGSRILADNPPAKTDADAIRQMEEAGGILVGALNMEELAYGFLTDNAHYGKTTNPHDVERTAGGSSGGSGAAVAAGMVPLALGSDTNGSIRIPAAFCGAVGFKPTYGRISRRGMTLLAPAQDHVGWIGGCVDDIVLAWSAAAGTSSNDLKKHGKDPVIAVAGGYFDELMTDDVRVAVERAAGLLEAGIRVELPYPDVARAAAYAITSSEASSLRIDDLRRQPERFDPSTRDRFLAGALLPAHWYIKAQAFRNWYREQVRSIFEKVDVILMPANPFPAPRFGEETIVIDGDTHPIRPTIGRFTQAVSSLGLPIICVPAAPAGKLPIGVQLMGRPREESTLLAVAAELEKRLASAN